MTILKILTGLLLAVCPFFILPNQDTREPKMIFSLVISMAIILSVFYYGYFKPVKNKWILLFLMYLPVCIFFSPKPDISLMNMPVFNFWIWKASSIFIIFSLFIISIYSIDFSFSDRLMFLRIMTWCGFLMSCYMILQYFGIDQFFYLRDLPISSLPPSARVGGTMGHPTIVAPFVAMIIPLALYFKKYLFAVLMIVAVIMTKSCVAIIALILSLLFILSLKNRFLMVGIILISILTGVLVRDLYICNPKIKKFINVSSSGRLNVWKLAFSDITKPLDKEKGNAYPLTGFSPGTFYYLFHIRHSDGVWDFLQAHNEYLELMYDTGIVGLCLFLCVLINLIWKNILDGLNRYRQYLLFSLVYISICAGGTFVWHIAPIIIYSGIIAGFLAKPKQEEEELCVI